MTKLPKYKVKTLRSKKKSLGLIRGSRPKRRYKQLIISLVGIYVIAGGILGFFFLNNRGSNTGEASQVANISSSIRFSEEKEYGLGDEVKLAVTLQNTSINESLSDVELDFLSTKESVKWKEAEIVGQGQNDIIELENNGLDLPLVSAGQRIQYEVTGTLNDNRSDFLTVLGKVRFNNKQGQQQTETNRIFTALNGQNKNLNELIPLEVSKEVFSLGEEVSLNLSAKEKFTTEQTAQGKIFISNQNSEEVAYSFDCFLEQDETCQVTTSDLEIGKYTALFIDSQKNLFSNIANFEIAGSSDQSNTFEPNAQANLIVPFGTGSINGLVPIIAERVVSKNLSLEGQVCEFEILQEEQKVASVKSPVSNDRSCRTIINADQLPSPEGLYTVKLANSNLEQQISFLPKPELLLDFEQITAEPEKAKNLEVIVKNIVENSENSNSSSSSESSSTSSSISSSSTSSSSSSESSSESSSTNSLNGLAATIKIYHHNTGELIEINSLQGSRVQVVNGEIAANIPGNYFQNSGQYLIWITLENQRQTDFLNLVFSDSEIGYTKSGIIVEDYSQLKVGSDVNLSIDKILDRDGQIVASGQCLLNFFTAQNGIDPTSIVSEIKEGKCQAILPAGSIKKSGPVLVTLAGGSGQNQIIQSRILYFASGNASDFGELNFEYQPIRKNFANNLIIGPVVDANFNLANSFGKKIVFTNLADETVKEFTDLNIIDGYLKLNVPASILNQDSLKIKLLDSKDKPLLEKEISTVETDQKLILPNIPEKIGDESTVEIGISGVSVEDVQNCKVQFIKNKEQFLEEEFAFNAENEGCETSWSINDFRDTKKALIKFHLGENVFTNLVELEAGEAANLFVTTPQVRFNSQDEMEVSLLTSPLIDRHGKVVQAGEVKWQYNGKIATTEILEGSAKLKLLAKNLETRDIQTKFEQNFLDLDLDVKAGISSVSSTNNINIFIQGFDLTNSFEELQLVQGSNYVQQEQSNIFSFKGSSCEAIILSASTIKTDVKTHFQGGNCYVTVDGNSGKNRILFEEDGFEIGSFSYQSGSENQIIKWCQDENESKCHISQVLAPTSSPIAAIVYDEDKQYKFASQDLENTITIKQNGLNPLKDYLVEITYQNSNGQKISFFNTLQGEKIME